MNSSRKIAALGTLAMAVAMMLATAGGAHAQDTTPKPGTETAPGQTGANFMRKAAEGNVAEIQLGQLAKKKSGNADVKAFSEKLVQDHSSALRRLDAVATSRNLKLPDQPSAEGAQAARHLEGLEGTGFDRAFADHMVKDHQKDIAAYERAARSGQEPAAEYARESLPVLRQHLQAATDLQRSLK